jgi:hypothetical protein
MGGSCFFDMERRNDVVKGRRSYSMKNEVIAEMPKNALTILNLPDLNLRSCKRLVLLIAHAHLRCSSLRDAG